MKRGEKQESKKERGRMNTSEGVESNLALLDEGGVEGEEAVGGALDGVHVHTTVKRVLRWLVHPISHFCHFRLYVSSFLLSFTFSLTLTPTLTPTLTSSPPHLLTSSPPHLLTSSPPHLLTSSPPHLLTSSPPHLLTCIFKKEEHLKGYCTPCATTAREIWSTGCGRGYLLYW